MNWKNSKIATILLIFFAFSCGGGGGGGGSPTTSSSPNIISQNPNWNANASATTISSYETAEYNNQSGLNQINASEAYALLEENSKEVAGSGVTIAVVDTGIEINHNEISGKYLPTYSYDYVNNDSNPTDDNGHGTHVSSIALGKKDGSAIHGVAYDASLVSIKVLNNTGNSNGVFFSEINESAVRISNSGAKVVNLSLGGASSSFFRTFFTTLKNADILSTAAAGNDANRNINPNQVWEPNYPALNAIDSDLQGYILAVGSVDSSNSISNFSNDCGSARNYCLVAPGENILSGLSNVYDGNPTIENISGSNYTRFSGTSMATPHVAGAAAVIRGAWPHLSATQTAQILLTTASDLGDAGVDEIYGHGLLNLEEAVQAQGQDTLSFGSSVNSSGYSVSQTSIISDPIFGDAFSVNVANALNGAVFFDDYGRDYKANLGDKIATTNSAGLNLNNFILSNFKSRTVPLNFDENFGVSLNFKLTDFKNGDAKNSYGLKYVILDNSVDPNLNLKNGFSFASKGFIQDKQKLGFAFNIDEISNIRSNNKFQNIGFITQNSFSANPFSSFFNTSNSLNNNNNFANSRNFNQIFFDHNLLNKKLNLSLSYQSSYDSNQLLTNVSNKQNDLVDLGLNYDVNKDLAVFFTVGEMTEFDNNMLNSKSYGAFETLNNVKTKYSKIALNYNWAKNFNILASYSEGLTQIAGNEQGIFRQFNNIKSRAVATAVTYKNFYGGTIGFGYQQPLRVYSGSATIDIATARDLAGNLTRYQENVSLTPNGKQQDYEIFYSLKLKNDANLNLNLVKQTQPSNIQNAKDNNLFFMQYSKIF